MPVYDFECRGCGKNYDEYAPFDKSGEYPGVSCPGCGSLEKNKIPSPFSVAFKDPMQSSKWTDNFNYRAEHLMHRGAEERRQAEQNSHMGTRPYGEVNNSDFDIPGAFDEVK